MNIRQNIRVNLLRLRKKSGLSPAHFAKKVQVKTMTYYGYEDGYSSPPLETLVRILENCGFKDYRKFLTEEIK
jgi:transcriptional regulator with XRE-family HTH domain